MKWERKKEDGGSSEESRKSRGIGWRKYGKGKWDSAREGKKGGKVEV